MQLKKKVLIGMLESRIKNNVKFIQNNDGSLYDCIIPISGGKDSTYQTYIIKEDLV